MKYNVRIKLCISQLKLNIVCSKETILIKTFNIFILMKIFN